MGNSDVVDAKIAPKFLRRVANLMVITQSAIVITGALVRLTGSGLGCSTWPECTPGSYTPSPDQPEAPLHAWIEFGNRLLTFVLFLNALVLMISILRNRKELFGLGAIQILGILAQAVLGGITVLTGLNPATVAGHFMLSIILIAAALSLRQRIYGKSPSGLIVSKLTRNLARALVLLTFVVLIAGTIVTGSGPHAGDSTAERFHLDARTISWIHADLVIALIGVAIALLISIQVGESGATREILGARIKVFLLASLVQGAIGYTQYFTGLPEVLVAFHILGSILVWLSAWNLVITGSVRILR
ncbi:MAG: COX15/CtaA family protein [Actinomycetales bacterium]|nr:COX15/CtaA family protein [Actinomycetales bacterium]